MIPEGLSVREAITEISQGNPGAVTVAVSLGKDFQAWDVLAHLYQHGPKGDNLWIYWKDRAPKEGDTRLSSDELSAATHASMVTLIDDLRSVAKEFSGWDPTDG